MLINADHRFHSLFDRTTMGIQMLTREGRTSLVNQAWVDLWQTADSRDLQDFILDSEWNVFTDAQLEAKGITAIVRRAFAGELVRIPPFFYDAAQLGAFGRGRWVSGYAQPVFDGEIVREVILMYDDVTERIRAESYNRLYEQRYRSLVKATKQLVWTTTADGTVEEDSSTWRDFTGQTYEEWRNYGWLNVIHPNDQEATFRLWADSIQNRHMYEATYRLLRLDGEYRWSVVRAVPVLDDEGNICEWVGTNMDIHELKMSQQHGGAACSMK